jgi:uncharacterized protein YaaQ
MTSTQYVDQMALATVAATQAGRLVEQLIANGFYVTQIDSLGGILREATVSLLIGLDKPRLPALLEIIRDCCPTHRQYLPAHAEVPILEAQMVMIEAEIRGATVYVCDVEHFEQL